MNDINFQTRALAAANPLARRPASVHASLWQQASQLFWRSYAQGRLLHLWSVLSRRPHRLLDLNDLCCRTCHQSYAGLQTVSLARIAGSEGRGRDFDTAFRPLNLRSRERWIRVALATLQATAMPAVQLIQVGDIYYVRDGHHRISVAIAWGQAFIDAEVTVWDAAPAVSSETPAAAVLPAILAVSSGG